MARKNKNAGGRRFDTRLTFKQICNRLKITPIERIIIIRNFKNRSGIFR